jgi:hypothetical protein
LTSGVQVGGSNRPANGYTNLQANGGFFGNDVTYAFTAGECVNGVDVSICMLAFTNQAYVRTYVVRVSDGVVMGSNEGNVNPPGCRTLNVSAANITPGQNYYIIVDGYSGQFDFNLTYTEGVNTTDTDSDGTPDCSDACPENPELVSEGVCGCDAVVDTDEDEVADCIDECPLLAGQIGSTCDPGPGFENGVITEECTCVGDPIPVVCNGTEVIVRIMTDNNGGQTTWTLTDVMENVVASGGPYTGENNTLVGDTICLANDLDGYRLRLADSFGDGLATGGYWEVRDMSGNVLLRDVFSSGSSSPSTTPANPSYGSAHMLYMPVGVASLNSSHCGKFDYVRQERVFANEVPGVTNYQFEFSDPDAGFFRRIAVPRNWVRFSEMQTNPLLNGTIYFARVRADQGAPGFTDDRFGTGCELGLTTQSNCTGLIDNPSASTNSCGVTRTFGGSSKIWTNPLSGATSYRFRFTHAASGFVRNIVTPGYMCALNWVTLPLQNGLTYDVQVEALVGGVWGGFCGPVCQVTIGTQANRRMMAAEEEAAIAEFRLWPNPSNDAQVRMEVTGLDVTLSHVDLDVIDLQGRTVRTDVLPVGDGTVNTVLQLNGVPSGVYVVRVHAGDVNFTQRLVLQF